MNPMLPLRRGLRKGHALAVGAESSREHVPDTAATTVDTTSTDANVSDHKPSVMPSTKPTTSPGEKKEAVEEHSKGDDGNDDDPNAYEVNVRCPLILGKTSIDPVLSDLDFLFTPYGYDEFLDYY